jgi:hypothetical protein
LLGLIQNGDEKAGLTGPKSSVSSSHAAGGEKTSVSAGGKIPRGIYEDAHPAEVETLSHYTFGQSLS